MHSHSTLVTVLLIPLLFVGIGVCARLLGRYDGNPSPKRENFAVATPMLLMTFSTIVADLVQLANNASAPGSGLIPTVTWLVAVFFLLFAYLTFERYLCFTVEDTSTNTGTNANMAPRTVRRPIVGILVPDLVSLGVFIAYQATKVP